MFVNPSSFVALLALMITGQINTATAVSTDAPTISFKPSSQPSSQPSEQPSSIPSEQPSSIPSEQPSGQPSSSPSEQPSSIPSVQPSGQPSSSPSEQPTGLPSVQPSGQPTGLPSVQPSGQPSSSPSEQPTRLPSVQPTGQPSETPSTQPSCTPSLAPTASGTVNLFYPDWTNGSGTCLNDGKHPNHMAANPAGYLFSTKASCCTTHYGWNYKLCVGGGPGTCSRALFYPDWSGSDVGCIDDGKEPAYMTNNAELYMYATLAECCKERYLWNYSDCSGTKTTNNGLYYPAFKSATNVCKNDGAQPQYMNDSPDHWLHAKLMDCCKTNYSWNYAQCTGNPGAPSPATTPTTASTPTTNVGRPWYPDWLGDDKSCKGDGNQPEYMTNSATLWMYASKKLCCDFRYSYNVAACMAP